MAQTTNTSGMTEDEAKEFHKFFTSSFYGFVGIAAFAHVLAWAWRPWLPKLEGYSAVETALKFFG